MNNQPALLSQRPLFQSLINITKPALPGYAEIGKHVQGIFESGTLTKGHHLEIFEQMAARHLGVKHAVAVSSCTTGLMLTYQALGLKGEVVVPSFTFMATVSALVWAGLRPVFADVDLSTTNLDSSAAEAAITPQTSALVAVHNFGNPADVFELQEVARRHGLRLIFDAAHGFGSLYQGRPVGSQGDAHVFSLTPTKLLVAGEGGVIATDDDDLAEKVRIGREYGNDGNYDCAFAGLNGRLPEFNALLGQYGLRHLDDAARHRNSLAHSYRGRLGLLPGIGFQEVRSGNRSSYKDFTITINPDAFGLTRDELALALAAENIETRKYYDPPVHRQTAYRRYAASAELTNTELLASRVLSLPIWSHMEEAVVAGICSAIEKAHEFAVEIKTALKDRDEYVACAAVES
jgi:dTDP-4-amino-4,6-dideoxygalactose transaminase